MYKIPDSTLSSTHTTILISRVLSHTAKISKDLHTASSLPSALEPVDGGGVNGYSLLSCDVGTVFEVVMLSLLLRLQIEPSQSAKVLLADSLVDGGPTPDPLTVVVSRVRPPISF